MVDVIKEDQLFFRMEDITQNYKKYEQEKGNIKSKINIFFYSKKRGNKIIHECLRMYMCANVYVN